MDPPSVAPLAFLKNYLFIFHEIFWNMPILQLFIIFGHSLDILILCSFVHSLVLLCVLYSCVCIFQPHTFPPGRAVCILCSWGDFRVRECRQAPFCVRQHLAHPSSHAFRISLRSMVSAWSALPPFPSIILGSPSRAFLHISEVCSPAGRGHPLLSERGSEGANSCLKYHC